MGIAHRSTRRPIAAALAVALAAMVTLSFAGCGDDSAKKPLRVIYLSVPQHGALTARGDDMEDAARLALEQTNYDTPDVRIELKIVDSDDPESAKQALDDQAAVAQVAFGRKASLLVNGLLSISLEPAAGGPEGPFGCVVSMPGLTSVSLLPSAYDSGAALAQAVAAEAPGGGRLVVGTSAFAHHASLGFAEAAKNLIGSDFDWRTTRSSARGINFVTDDRVYGIDRPQAPDPTSPGTLVTPALPPAGYPHNGEKFFEWFEDAYGRRPDRWAVWAYEATGLALNAITDAGEIKSSSDDPTIGQPASDGGAESVRRGGVIHAASRIKDRFGPVGHYDVTECGQTTLYSFAIRPWPIDAESEADDPRVIEVNR